ncbi:hypothetical protein GCM10022240_23050 [Microbacterium kribbense]|uniref:Single-stranded DNA-binding protein n=1 Tax=Microbacterium kribbense TaxID=433645 RepID=A0ABP7GNU5_9MICO
MSDMITITGNIAADPERRHIGSGVAVTTFRVGSSQRHFDRDKGQWVQTATNWYSVSAFRRLGDHAFASLHKGERVIVTGKLKVRQWESGDKHGTAIEIDADGIGHDLLWATTQYQRAEHEQQSWAVPGGAAGPDADPERAPEWDMTRPGAGAQSDAEGPDAGAARGGDWGAPAPEPGRPSDPAAGSVPVVTDAELVDTPF